MISIDEIKNFSFRRANFGGYKPEDVDQFIDDVEFSYGNLLNEKAKLLAEIKELRKKMDDYRGEEESIRKAIISAQRFADESIYSANSESKKIIQDANNEAASIISQAKDKAQKELEQAQNLRNHVIKFKNDVIAAYKEHLALITNLPEPVFLDLEEEKPLEEKIEKSNIADDSAADLPKDFGNTQKISENVFSSDDIEKKFGALKFGKNYRFDE